MEQSIPITATKTGNVLFRFSIPYILAGGSILIAFFLILRLVGLHMVTELRWINFALMIPVLIVVSKKYITTKHAKSYLESLGLNFITFIGSFVILSIFMIIYLSFIDPGMMALIRVSALPELQLTPFNVCILIIGESVVAGMILSFACTQYFQYRIRKMT